MFQEKKKTQCDRDLIREETGKAAETGQAEPMWRTRKREMNKRAHDEQQGRRTMAPESPKIKILHTGS